MWSKVSWKQYHRNLTKATICVNETCVIIDPTPLTFHYSLYLSDWKDLITSPCIFSYTYIKSIMKKILVRHSFSIKNDFKNSLHKNKLFVSKINNHAPISVRQASLTLLFFDKKCSFDSGKLWNFCQTNPKGVLHKFEFSIN